MFSESRVPQPGFLFSRLSSRMSIFHYFLQPNFSGNLDVYAMFLYLYLIKIRRVRIVVVYATIQTPDD